MCTVIPDCSSLTSMNIQHAIFINQSTSGTMFILCHMIDSDQSVKSFWKAPLNIRELCYMVYISLYFFTNNGPFIKPSCFWMCAEGFTPFQGMPYSEWYFFVCFFW